MIDLRKFREYTVEGLIGALADITTLHLGVLERQATEQSNYDRTYLNRYEASEATSHAARDTEARIYAQDDQQRLAAASQEVRVHTIVSEFLTNLIEWRTNGSQAPRLQRGQQADTTQGGSEQRSGERDLGGRGQESQQVREAS